MKQYLLAMLVLTGCNKSVPEPSADPREQYIGTYSGNSSYRYYYGKNFPILMGNSSGVVTISKDKEPKKINFKFLGTYTASATLNGSNFDLDPRTDASGFVVTGSGSFLGKTFSYSTASGGPPHDNLFTTVISGTRQ